MSALDREIVILVAVGAIVLDSLFLGVFDTLILALFGRGGWYATLIGGERIVYQGRHGVLFSGIGFALPNRVVVSDKRLAVTIAWSRAALVIAPVAALLSATPGTWWWHATVQVEFLERGSTALCGDTRQPRDTNGTCYCLAVGRIASGLSSIWGSQPWHRITSRSSGPLARFRSPRPLNVRVSWISLKLPAHRTIESEVVGT